MATLLGQQSLHRCCNASASLPRLRGVRIVSYHSSSRLLAGGQGRRAAFQTTFLRYPTPARFQSLAGHDTHARTNSCSSNHTPYRTRRIEECRVFADLYRQSISSSSRPRYSEKVRCEIPPQVFQNHWPAYSLTLASIAIHKFSNDVRDSLLCPRDLALG